jgi:predicted hydrolase (HD superfamily)
MADNMLNREEAYQLLTEYTTSDSLIKHALAVEALMQAYARKFGEDENTWGIVGLLHDFDYDNTQHLTFIRCRALLFLKKKAILNTSFMLLKPMQIIWDFHVTV